MKKRNIFFLIGFILLSSCSHTYYVPNTVNVPLFKEKNEVRFAGHYNSDNVTVYEFQAAYAITNNLAVMANYMYGYEYTYEYFKNDCGYGHYLDAAVGYYKPLNKHFVVEVFGGLGACSQYHLYKGEYLFFNGHYYPMMYYANMFFLKNFIQPSIGFTFDYFDIALSTRLAYLSYFNIIHNLPSSNGNIIDLQKIIAKRNFLVFEPALTIRGGWKYVKLQAQLCPSFSNDLLPSSGGIFSVGLYLSFAERFYRKNKENNLKTIP